MYPSTYLATEDIHSLTSAFDTDTLMIVLSAYFLAAAALKAWEIDSSNPKQESALLAVVSSRLPLLTCLVVREQKRFTLTNFNISTTFINPSWLHSSRHLPQRRSCAPSCWGKGLNSLYVWSWRSGRVFKTILAVTVVILVPLAEQYGCSTWVRRTLCLQVYGYLQLLKLW